MVPDWPISSGLVMQPYIQICCFRATHVVKGLAQNSCFYCTPLMGSNSQRNTSLRFSQSELTLFSLAYSNKVKAVLLMLCQCLSGHHTDSIWLFKTEAKEKVVILMQLLVQFVICFRCRIIADWFTAEIALKYSTCLSPLPGFFPVKTLPVLNSLLGGQVLGFFSALPCSSCYINTFKCNCK